MKSFSIEYIKSFKNKTAIDIKPITVLVGKNSCGKSSLLRFPAVLAQTMRDDAITPLKLCGSLIDYGTFKDIVFNHTDNSVSFSVTIDASVNDVSISPRYAKLFQDSDLDMRSIEIQTTLMMKEKMSVKQQRVLIDNACLYEFDNSKGDWYFKTYRVYDRNKREFEDHSFEIRLPKVLNHGFICVPSHKDIVEGIMSTYFPRSKFDVNNRQHRYQVEDVLFGEYDDEKVLEARKQIITGADILGAKKRRGSAGKSAFMDFVSVFTDAVVSIEMRRNRELATQRKEMEVVERYYELLSKQTMKEGYSFEEAVYWYICSSFRFFEQLSFSLYLSIKNALAGLTYIGPFRQNPSRIYRDESSVPLIIGTKGENTVDYLISDFHSNQKLVEKVSEWLYKSFGYKLSLANVSNGFFQVMLEDSHGVKSNIADVGYGISQILPIIVEVFNRSLEIETIVPLRNSMREGGDDLVLIEQPELHLHPAAQAELATLFVKCLEADRICDFVIETHSEHFIRKLQVLVADKSEHISSDDVAIYYVDKKKDGSASVERLNLLPNGQFENEWPSGFFDKSFQLSMELLSKNSEDAEND